MNHQLYKSYIIYIAYTLVPCIQLPLLMSSSGVVWVWTSSAQGSRGFRSQNLHTPTDGWEKAEAKTAGKKYAV